jgi:hypothetical protein
VITNCLVITNATLTKDDLTFIVDSLEHFSSLQLPSDHYKPLSYDEEFRHWSGNAIWNVSQCCGSERFFSDSDPKTNILTQIFFFIGASN